MTYGFLPLAATMLLAAFAMAAPVAAAVLPPGPARTTDNLNIRTGPGLDFDVVTVIPRGATVSITGAPRNNFYPLTYGDYAGWSYGEYLTPVDDPDALPPGPAYTTAALRLRDGPGPSNKVLRVVPNATKVFILGKPQSNWYPTRYDGTRGWASGAYLSEKKHDPVHFVPKTRVQKLVRRVLVKNGLASQWDVVAKIVTRESNWVPTALHMDTNGHYARGLFQINDEWFASWWKQYDLHWNSAADNTAMAIKIYHASNNCWTPWGEGCGVASDEPPQG